MTQAFKKILLGAALIVGLGGYVQWSSTQNQTASAQTSNTNAQPVNTVVDTASVQTTLTATVQPIAIATTPKPVVVTPTPNPVQTGIYKNGTYTGSVASTNYGDVQVSATITGGKLSNVTFLTYPSDRGHSIEISQYAMPILKSEAIAAQSANVDIVSGATQISGGFQSSLADALAAAHV